MHNARSLKRKQAARPPEGRIKHPAAREGRPSTESARDLELLRRIKDGPKSQALRRRMSEPPRRRSDLLGHYEKWTPEELDMLGTVPDREIARLVGRSVAAVRAKRYSLLEE